MGFNNQFFLDDLEIDEPVGFAQDTTFSIKRGDKHGIGFEASDSALRFYGDAATYLRNKKINEGLLANVVFRAYIGCDGEDPELAIEGRLNFGKYRELCGLTCGVSMPVETTSCELVVLSRIENDVDLDKETAFDNLTALTNYSKLNYEITLPSKNIPVGAVGDLDPDGETINVGAISSTNYRSYSRPSYRVTDGSIQTQQLDNPTYEWADSEPGFDFLTPQVLLSTTAKCSTNSFDLNVRMKGSMTDARPFSRNIWLSFVIGRGEFSNVGGTFPTTGGLDIIHQVDILVSSPFTSGTQDFAFDESFTGSITLNEDQGLYAYMFFRSDSGVEQAMHPVFTYDEETSFELTAIQSCPETKANVYEIHEALSRVVESISNGCCRVQSSYYGRTDSQPFSFNTDGCGSLRAITSGLKIRRAENATVFTSLRKLFDGLNCIDNIGMDVAPDADPYGQYVLRIEDVGFFYQDFEIMRCPGLSNDSNGSRDIDQSRFFVKINIGYKKWEVENIHGTDEINATREFRTQLDTVQNTKDLTSELVAGGYAIEITRQQGFAEEGNSDTTYDNDNFIICLRRGVYGDEVETGNIDDPANIIDSSTVYNYRISPMRNLMRWFKSLINSYPNIYDGIAKLYFSSGAANFRACGLMTDPGCRLENSSICENDDVSIGKFADPATATPIWENEVITFDYPLTLQQYKTIKANPYGYISYQCGTGDFEKGFILSIEYKISDGMASFQLLKKWDK